MLYSIVTICWSYDKYIDFRIVSRLKNMDLVFSHFLSLFYFIFQFIFYFSIFRTLGLGLEVISHTITSITFDGVVTTLIIGLKRRK